MDHRWILAHEKGFTYTEEVKAELRRLYREEAIYTDTQLGVLLDGFKSLGLQDTAMVVVLADHGEMLGEHGYEFNHHSLYEGAVRVPLAIRIPDLLGGGRKVEAQVRMMDIPATILSWLRMDPLSPSEGEDLLPYALGNSSQPLTASLVGRRTASLEEGSLYGLRTGKGSTRASSAIKYILDADTGTQWLFDLEADPQETTDLADQQPQVIETCRAFVNEERATKRIRIIRKDDATLQGLKALGYVDGDPE